MPKLENYRVFELEKEGQIKSNENRRNEIIEIRSELKRYENIKTFNKITETKS